ncbi:hypothetical protein Tco_0337229 [Tanacetum coccineum]
MELGFGFDSGRAEVDCRRLRLDFLWLHDHSSVLIIMVNEIPPGYMDDVPVVEPNQHDDVYVDLEPVLVDKDEDPKDDEFEEEEDPQEE